MRSLTGSIAIAAVALLAQPAIGAQIPSTTPPGKSIVSAPQPSAPEILDRFVEATGGQAAYAKHTSLVVTGTVEVIGAGIDGRMETYALAPNRFASTVVLGGFGTIRDVYDGKTGWESSSLQGVRELSGSELAILRRQAIFNADASWRDVWKAPETVSTETLGDRTVFVVKLTPKDGTGGELTNYYDTQSYLLVRTDSVVETESATIPIVTTYGDYRLVDGVKIPFVTEQQLATGRIRVTATTAAFNTKIEESVFSKPLAP